MYLQRCHSLSALGNEGAAAKALAAGKSALVLTPVLGTLAPSRAQVACSSEPIPAADVSPTGALPSLHPPSRAVGNAQHLEAAEALPTAQQRATATTGADVEPLSESVPLALICPMDNDLPPRWWQPLLAFAEPLKDAGWGSRRRPVFITGSNYGVDNLYAITADKDPRRIPWAAQHGIVAELRAQLGWGRNLTVISHACVSAQMGLLLAERALRNGQADEALVFSFDFLSPFVTGGFHALKILNNQMPQPYLRCPTGSIGLGDGAAWAILSHTPSAHRIASQSVFNEMHHFTANAADGSGFRKVLAPLRPLAAGRKLLIKGHGTGTLEAGELEVRACLEAFGSDAPLVSWKGGLGHTLGSCALVELAILLAARAQGKIPPTVFAEAAQAEPFGENVATAALDPASMDASLLLSNAFGGAHAAMLVCHES